MKRIPKIAVAIMLLAVSLSSWLWIKTEMRRREPEVLEYASGYQMHSIRQELIPGDLYDGKFNPAQDRLFGVFDVGREALKRTADGSRSVYPTRESTYPLYPNVSVHPSQEKAMIGLFHGNYRPWGSWFDAFLFYTWAEVLTDGQMKPLVRFKQPPNNFSQLCKPLGWDKEGAFYFERSIHVRGMDIRTYYQLIKSKAAPSR